MTKQVPKQGFSLTEVIFSFLIMSIIALSLANIVPESYFVSYRTQDIATASDLAQKYLEEVKNELKTMSVYDNTAEGTTSPIEITDDFTYKDKYNVQVNILNVGATGREAYLKEITVVYTKADNQNELVNISTVIKRPDYSI